MIHIYKILVPVDFSEASKKAVNYGLSFARQCDARLILAHVGECDAAAHDKAKADLLELIPAESRERLTYEIVVKSGDIRTELLRIVKESHIDLVVMGTRGRSYFGRMILGSVTESMLRALHVPVLTVSHLDSRTDLHVPASAPLKRIFYATDLASGSEGGLRFAVRLAQGLGACLTIAHVIHVDVALHGVAEVPLVGETRAKAREKLTRMVALLSDGSVPISTVLADEGSRETINTLASQANADLIVINLQNKGFERAILGSTAEQIIRTARVPVLSLPLPGINAWRLIA